MIRWPISKRRRTDGCREIHTPCCNSWREPRTIAPLSTLHRLIERVRSKEGEGRKSRRKDWLAVRGALHLALARRGSRVALYDLRESIERAEEPLPADFLEAVALIGDASCLEPVATAFVQSAAMPDAEGVAPRAGRCVPGDRRARRHHGTTRRDAAREVTFSRARGVVGPAVPQIRNPQSAIANTPSQTALR